MSAIAEALFHLEVAVEAVKRAALEKVASEEEIRELILKVNELTIRLREKEE